MEKKVYEFYKRSTAISQPADIKAVSDVTSKVTTKTPRATTARKSTVKKPRIAMYIDVDNVGISRENLLEVLFYANGKYKIDQCKLYGFSDETLPGIRDIATEYNVTTIGKMKFKQSGVNCLDPRLLIDAYECASNNRGKIDMIFVWCYPCDLSELFEKIIDLGVNTSTIDNDLFDCKNKFVSQKFKLYSPYNFSLEQTTYGKVRNQPAETVPSPNFEKESTTEEVKTLNKDVSDKLDKNESKFSIFDENNVPPVLPRRSIPERSNPNSPKVEKEVEQEVQPEVEESDAPSSLVEEIARKLNLSISSPGETPSEETEEIEEPEEQSDLQSNLIMNLLKQAGFDDFSLDKKELKYEDTIGDL